MTDKQTFMKELKYPHGVKVLSRSHNTTDDVIFIDGETSDWRLSYWTENPDYVFGVHPELNEIIEKAGWFAEWEDPGTLALYPA
jgi:hypothetical protein